MFVLEQNNQYKPKIEINFMSLNEKIDIDLLKSFYSPDSVSAIKLIMKFEKYYGKSPTEQDFYNVYLKYSKYENVYGNPFKADGVLKDLAMRNLNSLKLWLPQLKLIEKYLIHKKIIKKV